MRISLFVVILAFAMIHILPAGVVHAANEQQEECFTYLKSSILAVPAFSSVHSVVKDSSYSDVQNQLSDYYKNVSSFGIDLRSPDFDMKVYSFGRDTGYQHPPFSPFPSYTMSDKWETPAKEYIYAEEYVRNSETNERVFLSCALMKIESLDLSGVTAEKYLYDGQLSSVLYTSPDQSYKAWYSNNDSYDHEGRNFVTWRRLFVYPKSTTNSFFDRYTVADAFPARVTDNLGDIKKLISRDHTAETRELLSQPEMKGADAVFALNSYYQAIENSFPDFSSKLALRGVIDYGTVKELLATRGVSAFATIWQSVLDPREITKYALLKVKGELKPDNSDGVTEVGEESVFFEDQLEKIKNMTIGQEAEYLLKTVSERNPVPEEEVMETAEAVQTNESGLQEPYRIFMLISVIIIILVFSSLLVLFRKKGVTDNNVISQ